MGACASCLEGPPAAGVADANKPGASTITVRLTVGTEVKVHVLPSDTMETINAKVIEVHGQQPKVVVRGERVDPVLLARHKGHWIPVRWDARVSDVNAPLYKYSDITDKLKQIKAFSHLHWGASHLVHGQFL